MNKRLCVVAEIFNMPYELKKGWLVARLDITLMKPQLWYYGLYDDKDRAEQVAYELRNGVVFEVTDDKKRIIAGVEQETDYH
jgi:hypothetical protein